MVKLIVAGSRTFSDYPLLCYELDAFIAGRAVEIISGGALGADSLGEKYARERRLKLHIFEANWSLYGKSAGYKRNEQMARYAGNEGACVAFWDGVSKGTQHMINIAREHNLPVKIVKFGENKVAEELTKITVINGKVHGFLGKDKLYIGRAGRGLPGSVLANPYKIGVHGDRAAAIELYRQWLWRHCCDYTKRGIESEVWNELIRLAWIVVEGGSIQLTCYCKPQPCHGDVIKNAVQWIIANQWYLPF